MEASVPAFANLFRDSADEIERLLGGIQYWSYCMDQGMRHTDTASCGELYEFLSSCDVAPYSVRNQANEVVTIARLENPNFQ